MVSVIRYATRNDIPALIALARQEHAQSTWAQALPFDARAVESTALQFIEQPGRTVLMTDGGYLAGLVQPLGFTAATAAMEWAWFAVDGSGLALAARFEAWARRMGATLVVLHNYSGDARLARVLADRRHYQRAGDAWTRDIRS